MTAISSVGYAGFVGKRRQQPATKERIPMKQPAKQKRLSLSEALDQAAREVAPRGRGFHKLQQVADLLEETEESEAFFMLLFSHNVSAALLHRAINLKGVKVSYQTVLHWRKLHQERRLVFRNGKVQRGFRS